MQIVIHESKINQSPNLIARISNALPVSVDKFTLWEIGQELDFQTIFTTINGIDMSLSAEYDGVKRSPIKMLEYIIGVNYEDIHLRLLEL